MGCQSYFGSKQLTKHDLPSTSLVQYTTEEFVTFPPARRMLSKDLGAKIRNLQCGQSVSLGHVTLSSLGKDREMLECDEVCAQEERNRTVAAALGISNPVINPLKPSLPRYSDTLLELARLNNILAWIATFIHHYKKQREGGREGVFAYKSMPAYKMYINSSAKAMQQTLTR